MGIRPSLNNQSAGTQAVDAKIGEAYHVVKTVEENLGVILELGTRIDSLTGVLDNLDDILAADEDAETASAAAELAELKAGQASASATSSVNAKVAAETAASNAAASEAVVTTKASEAAASAANAAAAAAIAGGFAFVFSSTTADADPGPGTFRLNHATLASVTAAFIDNTDAQGNTVSSWLDTMDDSTSVTKGALVLRSQQNPTAWGIFRVTGSVVSGTGYRKLTLEHVASSGPFTNGHTFSALFTQTGDAGSGAVILVNGKDGVVVLHTDDLSDAGRTNKWSTAAEKTKIGHLTVTSATDLDAMRTTISGLGTASTKNTGTGAGQIPLLDGSGLLATSVLPALAITDTFEVADQTAMLAASAQKGDIAIRADLSKCFILTTNSPSTLADWKELKTPTDVVLAVAGLTGTITAAALRTALALTVADITDMTANGRSFVAAANYAAMKVLLGLDQVSNTSDATERAATATLTNKRITPRAPEVASTATLTIDSDASDQYSITAQAVNLTVAAPTGTPTSGQGLIIRITDNGTPRTISWNAVFRGLGFTLPASTVANKTLYIGFKYNVAATKWDCLALQQEA